jgi:hypothetical protein
MQPAIAGVGSALPSSVHPRGSTPLEHRINKLRAQAAKHLSETRGTPHRAHHTHFFYSFTTNQSIALLRHGHTRAVFLAAAVHRRAGPTNPRDH